MNSLTGSGRPSEKAQEKRNAPKKVGGGEKMYGGSGNDVLDTLDYSTFYQYYYGDLPTRGSQLFGQIGEDTLNGSRANDWLDGGIDYDSLNGKEGSDKCFNGELYSNCENLI